MYNFIYINEVLIKALPGSRKYLYTVPILYTSGSLQIQIFEPWWIPIDLHTTPESQILNNAVEPGVL